MPLVSKTVRKASGAKSQALHSTRRSGGGRSILRRRGALSARAATPGHSQALGAALAVTGARPLVRPCRQGIAGAERAAAMARMAAMPRKLEMSFSWVVKGVRWLRPSDWA